MPYKCLYTKEKKTRSNSTSVTAGLLMFILPNYPSSRPNYLDGSVLHCQYNCCKKINWGSEYPVTADLSNVSDEGDWLPVMGSSIWWSSVPMGRGSAKDISEGFTSMDSDKGLFWLWMDSCSLKELSSALQSGGVSDPEGKRKKFKSSCKNSANSLWNDCQTLGVSNTARAAGLAVVSTCFEAQISSRYNVSTENRILCYL